jgi:hypothetical protein
LAVEGLPITGMGNDEFQVNRDNLGRTHEMIAKKLAYNEQTHIIPDD